MVNSALNVYLGNLKFIVFKTTQHYVLIYNTAQSSYNWIA